MAIQNLDLGSFLLIMDPNQRQNLKLSLANLKLTKLKVKQLHDLKPLDRDLQPSVKLAIGRYLLTHDNNGCLPEFTAQRYRRYARRIHDELKSGKYNLIELLCHPLGNYLPQPGPNKQSAKSLNTRLKRLRALRDRD